jgi:hypothetical protein
LLAEDQHKHGRGAGAAAVAWAFRLLGAMRFSMAQLREPVCDDPRGRSVSDPVVDVGLLQVLKRDLAVVERVEEVDRDGDGLLGGARGALVRRAILRARVPLVYQTRNDVCCTDGSPSQIEPLWGDASLLVAPLAGGVGEVVAAGERE